MILFHSSPQQSITCLPRNPSSLTLIGFSVLILLMTRTTAAAASLGGSSSSRGFHMSTSVAVSRRASAHQHQRASSTVLGTPPPAITMTGDSKRPFGVENNTFTDYPSARQRSCGDQFNTCQLMANTDKTAGFTVSDCQNQQSSCLQINQAVVVESSSTSSSSSTSTSTSTTSTSSSTLFPTSSTSTSTSTTSPLITSTTLASLTQPATPQQTTITQGDFIFICDL